MADRDLHPHVPVLVWADVDIGIAETVIALNQIEGVRTTSSCQGTIGEGGAEPYPAFVGVHWSDDAGLEAIRRRWRIVVEGNHWGYVYPDPRESAPERSADARKSHG